MHENPPKRRLELLEQLSGARTEPEVSEAEREVDIYLKQYPHDLDVVVAAEKLEKRAARVRDPERGANRWSVVVFVGITALVVLVVFGYTRTWVPGVLVGVMLAGLVSELVWEILKTRAERGETRPDDSGPK